MRRFVREEDVVRAGPTAPLSETDVEEMLEIARQKGEPPFLILCDEVADPHNLGAILRTAEIAGAHGVIVPRHRGVGITPAVAKASAGAVFHVPVAKVTNLVRTMEELKQADVKALRQADGMDIRSAEAVYRFFHSQDQ